MHSPIRKGGAERGRKGGAFIRTVNSWLLRDSFYCPPQECEVMGLRRTHTHKQTTNNNTKEDTTLT